MKPSIASPKDLLEVKKLWSYCFADSQEFTDYYFEKRYIQENNVVVMDEEGQIKASLQLNPYNLIVEDVIKNVNYVVGVCVQPESRGLGYSSMLMRDTLNLQYNNNEDISILMPIDTHLYTKYGYTNCFYRYEFKVDLINIKTEKTQYHVKRLNLEKIFEKEEHNFPHELAEAIEELSDFYHTQIRPGFAYIRRDKKYFVDKLQELSIDGGDLFLAYEGEVIKGYMMLLPKYQQDHGMVLEMMFENKTAHTTLMGIIKSHITQFKTVDIITPQHELFNTFINYDNKYNVTKKSFMMARVIDAKNILIETVKRSSLYQKDMAFSVKITDEMIDENDIVIEFNKGINKSEDIPFMTLHISDLAGLYMRSTTIEYLEKSEKIEFENEERRKFFRELFGSEVRENYINDFI
ncbi:MAG: GNAT family N-acetyltransferase [Proteocatella sp.]